jgi:hypothetical protein
MFGVRLRTNGYILAGGHRHGASHEPRDTSYQDIIARRSSRSHAKDQTCGRDDAIVGPENRRSQPSDAVDEVALRMLAETSHAAPISQVDAIVVHLITRLNGILSRTGHGLVRGQGLVERAILRGQARPLNGVPYENITSGSTYGAVHSAAALRAASRCTACRSETSSWRRAAANNRPTLLRPGLPAARAHPALRPARAWRFTASSGEKFVRRGCLASNPRGSSFN